MRGNDELLLGVGILQWLLDGMHSAQDSRAWRRCGNPRVRFTVRVKLMVTARARVWMRVSVEVRVRLGFGLGLELLNLDVVGR